MPVLSVKSAPIARITRRQEAANEYQRKHANLGFAFFRPKERRAGCPCFPYS